MNSDANMLALRERAEALIDKSDLQVAATSPAEIQRLVHELQVYQTELELQNDELRRTQQELTAARDKFSDLYDFSPVGYLTVCPKGQILSANLTACELFGLTRSELIGTFFSTLVSESDTDELFLHYKSARQSGNRESCELQLQADAEQEHTRYVQAQSIRVAKKSDVIVSDSLHIALTEITAQKRAEETQAALTEKLRQAERLQSLGKIAGGVAHDFNNLLTPIMAYAELARGTLEQTSPVQEHLGEIRQAALIAADICRNMFDCVGTGRPPRTPLDAVEVVKELLPTIEGIVSENIKIECVYCESALPIIAQPAQLQRVVTNLVMNAAEAIGESQTGRITVAIREAVVSEDERSRLILGTELNPGNLVLLEVTDNGCGMDAETRRQLFDPFFTTKFSGRGLGMSAVIGIARGHGAAIGIESQPGIGTKLSVYFAKAGDIVSIGNPASDSKSSPSAITPGSGTILVVDDNEFVRDSLRSLLESAGYRVMIASSGNQAIELFSTSYASIDLVLLDLLMPGLDGAATLEVLRQVQPSVKALITSACSQQTVSEKLRFHGVAADCVPKPFLPAVVTGEISRILSESSSDPRGGNG